VSRRLDDLREHVGEPRTTVEGFAVEAGKVEEFARAVGDDNPVHRDANAATGQGFDRVPAPLTFTRTSTFPRYLDLATLSYAR
jgi:peroxisomal enoyl-CoA hydratase 2